MLEKQHGPAYLEKLRLVKVHKDFRVVALGLPVGYDMMVATVLYEKKEEGVGEGSQRPLR